MAVLECASLLCHVSRCTGLLQRPRVPIVGRIFGAANHGSQMTMSFVRDEEISHRVCRQEQRCSFCKRLILLLARP
jgi:hypothetical protein